MLGHNWVGYVVAGLSGVAIAYLEVATHLKSRPTLVDHALAWWIPRLALEAAVGMAALWGLQQSTDSSWSRSVLGWILAGLGGAAIARSQVLTFPIHGVDRPI